MSAPSNVRLTHRRSQYRRTGRVQRLVGRASMRYRVIAIETRGRSMNVTIASTQAG